MNAGLPPYSDQCPECPVRVVVPPMQVWPADNGHGVTVDYLCPVGHTWHTGWAWWAGEPHSTDLDDWTGWVA